MAIHIYQLLQIGPLSKVQIAKSFGKDKPTRYMDELLQRLLAEGFIEQTLPDKPNSRLQKYRLSAKGRAKNDAILRAQRKRTKIVKANKNEKE